LGGTNLFEEVAEELVNFQSRIDVFVVHELSIIEAVFEEVFDGGGKLPGKPPDQAALVGDSNAEGAVGMEEEA